MEAVTDKLYAVAQVRELERRAIASGIAGYTLMQRAAARCWREIETRWPDVRRIHVVCGSGNNSGDGYEIASLAQAAGREVRLIQVGTPPTMGDGLRARQSWPGEVTPFSANALKGAGLIVDALFGIGLRREVQGAAREAVEAINGAHVPVLAVDVPSGLDADSGAVRGVAVRADVTVCFIAQKPGLLTGAAVDLVGEYVLDTLGLPESLYATELPVARRLTVELLRQGLPRRARNSHKGRHGHVLVVGGNTGLMGAALLTGRAALRGGAGLVSVATRAVHAAALTAAQAELMCHGVESAQQLGSLLARADVIAFGPGLGQDAWARNLLAAVLETNLPTVLDADALNLLAEGLERRERWVLTPHPGEAARLLGQTTAEVQQDRPQAVRNLQQRYGGVAVLKGAGTLVQGRELRVCTDGNPGMAVGGMGDVLTGVIAALMAQGLSPESAAQIGVLAHARAGDLAAREGERGLLPSDLLNHLRAELNP